MPQQSKKRAPTPKPRRRLRTIASFENLVALANYEERLIEARKIVWRDRGELPKEVNDLWECFEHAGRGGTRAAILAFAIRSGVNFLLALSRLSKVHKDIRVAVIKHALFGLDSFRFAGMFGSFVFLYKYILNSLPLLLPPKNHLENTFDDDDEDIELGTIRSRKARLSTTAQAHQTIQRKQTRGWYPLLAGGIAGGVAIMFEKRSRRILIGQQLFVRGLQGSYNALSTKYNFTIPHGDAILFALACGQIMYGFLLRPDTLPRSYNSWIGQAGKIPRDVVEMNRCLVREGTFEIENIDSLISIPNINPLNKTELIARRADALLRTPNYGELYAPCAGVHPPINSCLVVFPDRFYRVFKWMVPVYGALHFIPMLLFKRKRFLQDPMKMILRTTWGTARSSAFLGLFVAVYQGLYCGKHNLFEALRSTGLLPQALTNLLISKGSFWIVGFLSGLAVFLEEKRRRAELAMYVLPKGLESAWVAARGKGLVMRTGEFGDALFAAVGMGMVMRAYQHDPQNLSGLVRRIIYQFVGPN